MSLQVWLPLVKDLSNQGLSNYNISMFRGTETYNTNGKLGKCFYANGVNTIKILNIIPDFYNYTAYSISAWFYIEARNTAHSGSAIISAGNWNSQVINLAVSDWSSDHYTLLRISGTSWGKTYSYNFNLNTWYHVVVSCDSSKTYAYVNGVLIGDTQSSFLPTSVEGNDIAIGGATYASAMQFFGKINDVRIYDHALSPKEVKLLSQGLVCHYKLSDIYATDNLIPNGYGQDGTTGWNNSTNFSTSEIPTGHSEIKASFYGGNTTTTFIPISQGTTYTLSAYLKAKGSGTSYPSIFPYDADKHIIMAYNCADGFSNSYRTTLAQPLKKGDTVIYATDLSTWTTGDNYYYHVAIFGYKDSQGRVYPDMGYTYDSPVFGTKTDKSHINKTNNTITLNSAFTGEDRPAGTVICQATEGSTYYYPFGYVPTSSVSDWTLKTAVLSPSTTHRLKYAKYINYMAYSGLYHAGIKLVDNNFSEPYVLDSSGYNNHCNVITSGLVTNSDSPRNNLSTYFNGAAQVSRESVSVETRTISFWLKTTKTNQVCCFADYKSRLGFGFKSDGTIVTTCASFNIKTYSPSAITDNVWHHIGIVKKADDSDVLLYVDGILQSTRSGADSWTHTTDVFTLTGRSYGSPAKMTCYLSDFRLYATALSQEDIQQLYNTPVSVANTGAMLTQGEFVEVVT